MTKPEFMKLAAYLEAGSGATKPMTTVQLEVYWDQLQGLDFATAQNAARLAIREHQFSSIPPVGVVLKFAGVAGKRLETPDRATTAYLAATRAVRLHGGYQSVSFDDPLVNAVIRSMGGWAQFCDCQLDQVQWRKRDFEGRYAALAKAGTDSSECGHLPGIFEQTNIGATVDVQQVACNLPGHPTGLIRGEVPGRLEHRQPLPATKRLVHSLRLTDETVEKKSERPTQEELIQRRADSVARLRQGALGNVTAKNE